VITPVAEPRASEPWDGTTRPQRLTGGGRFLTDVILELGLADRERVEQAIETARVQGNTPEAVLVESGAISQMALSRAIAQRHSLDHLDLSTYAVDMTAANLVKAAAAKRYEAVPVARIGENGLLVAMADPANVLAVDDIALMTGHEVRAAVASREDILGLIQRHVAPRRRGGQHHGGRGDRPRARRDRRPARLGRRGAGHQARQPDHRPGGRAGRLGHPHGSRRHAAARALPDRRGARGDDDRCRGAWSAA
jgi:hypothetical protein